MSPNQVPWHESLFGQSTGRARVVCALIACGLALAHLGFSWYGRNAGIGWGEDDAQYIFLAKSIAERHYREIWDVAASIHARYPPLFPALLAVIGVVTDWSIDAMLLFVAICSSVSLVLIYDAARRHVHPLLALLAVGLAAVTPMGLRDTAYVMSEAPFKLFLAVGLWGLSRNNDGARFAVVAAVGLVAASLTRSAGVVLVGALFLFWLYRRQFQRATWFALFAASTVGGWTVWSMYAPDASAHLLYRADLALLANDDELGGNWGGILRGILGELPRRLQRMATVMIPTVLAFHTKSGTLVDNVAWLALLLLTMPAGLVRLTRRWPAATALLVSYLTLVVLWTWELERLLTPVAPLLFLAMLVGLGWWTERFSKRWAMPLLGVVVLLLSIGPVVQLRITLNSQRGCDRDRPSDSVACFKNEDERLFAKAAEWVRDSTPKGALVFTDKEAAFALRSNRRGINQRSALEQSASTLLSSLRERGVGYMVVSAVGPRAEDHRHAAVRLCSDLVFVRGFGPKQLIFRVRGLNETADVQACTMLGEGAAGLEAS
jgi:hypothetical protein